MVFHDHRTKSPYDGFGNPFVQERNRALAERFFPMSQTMSVEPVTKPNLRRALELVKQMMAIPGPSGAEGQIVEFIRRKLLAAGVTEKQLRTDGAHKRSRLKGEVGNLILKLPGTRRGPRRLLMAHVDTVPLCVGSRPVRKGAMIRSGDPRTALGADDRAGAAVVLASVLEILEQELPHPPLTCLWTVQEEIGLRGAKHLSLSMLGRPKLAFNFDGGSPVKLTIGATGAYRRTYTIDGIASHAGGAPEKGVSAVAIAALAVARLQADGWHGDIHKNGCHGTSNVGVIQGGQATNVVTDRVVVKAECRSHDRDFRKRIVDTFDRTFREAAEQVHNIEGESGRVEIEGDLDYESFFLNENELCVSLAEEAVRRLGHEPIPAIANGGVDANWMFAHGIPTVTLGAGQLNQHMVSEALDIAAFQDACRIALTLATGTEESK